MALSRIFSKFASDEELSQVSGYFQQRSDSFSGDLAASIDWSSKALLGSWNINDFYAGNFKKAGVNIFYDTSFAATTSQSQALTGALDGLWLRCSGTWTGAGLIRSRSPVLAFEYSAKVSPANNPHIPYRTYISATQLAPFEIYSSAATTSGLGLVKILGISNQGNISPSANSSNLHGVTTIFGGVTQGSGSANLSFAPFSPTQIGSCTLPSGMVEVDYTVQLGYPVSTDGNRTFRIFPTFDVNPFQGFFMPEAETYVTIPPGASGYQTVRGGFRVAVTGAGNFQLQAHMVSDTSSEGTLVSTSGFLRATIAAI